MEQILFGLQGVEISVDDVIIHAKSLEKLIVRIRAVFARCREYNLRLNPDKCMLGLTEMPVLGHVISAEGIKPDPSKTEAIRQAPLTNKRFGNKVIFRYVWLFSKIYSQLRRNR